MFSTNFQRLHQLVKRTNYPSRLEGVRTNYYGTRRVSAPSWIATPRRERQHFATSPYQELESRHGSTLFTWRYYFFRLYWLQHDVLFTVCLMHSRLGCLMTVLPSASITVLRSWWARYRVAVSLTLVDLYRTVHYHGSSLRDNILVQISRGWPQTYRTVPWSKFQCTEWPCISPWPKEYQPSTLNGRLAVPWNVVFVPWLSGTVRFSFFLLTLLPRALNNGRSQYACISHLYDQLTMYRKFSVGFISTVYFTFASMCGLLLHPCLGWWWWS